jgi:hypothetical protein
MGVDRLLEIRVRIHTLRTGASGRQPKGGEIFLRTQSHSLDEEGLCQETEEGGERIQASVDVTSDPTG